MHFVILSGSQRDKSQSIKISKWLAKVLDESDATTDIISMADNPLPFWDDSAWDKDSELAAHAKPYQERMAKADGVILVAPEWHGMVPGALKNFLLYVGSAQTAHKPCLLVGVSTSTGGAYPIAELRVSGYKNNRMVYIPDHLIVRNAENVMNDHDMSAEDGEDIYIKKRALYSLNVLRTYTQALRDMREKHDLFDPAYPFGM